MRDALEWSRQINKALYLFGREAEVMFASHSWPRWGNERIQEVMRTQRDAYAHLNNGVMHLANQGVTINEIHNVYRVPESLARQWPARSYHGSVAHNCRAVINRAPWARGPQAHDDAPTARPADSAPLYVQMMGGAEPILERGRSLLDQGQYLLATEILDKLVHAQPDNEPARQLLADAFEQIGYQQESPSLRRPLPGRRTWSSAPASRPGSRRPAPGRPGARPVNEPVPRRPRHPAGPAARPRVRLHRQRGDPGYR